MKQKTLTLMTQTMGFVSNAIGRLSRAYQAVKDTAYFQAFALVLSVSLVMLSAYEFTYWLYEY